MDEIIEHEEHDLSRFENCFVTDTENNTVRISGRGGQKRRDIEFIDALNYLADNVTYNSNEIENWLADKQEQGVSCCDSQGACDCRNICICGQTIKYSYWITKHSRSPSSPMTVQVGSDCIRKLSQSLYQSLINDKCKVCSGVLSDKRKKFQNQGFCDKSCSNWEWCGKWKHTKGGIQKSYYDIVTKDKQYASWLLKKWTFDSRDQKKLKYYLIQNGA